MARKRDMSVNMMNALTEISTENSKKSHKEKMDMLQEISLKFRKNGDIEQAKDLQHFLKEDRKTERHANEEMKKLMGAAAFRKMLGIPEEHRTGDGDQSPVYDHFEINKLKRMWASGMNWHPNNAFNSPWMLALAAGDYNEMLKIIDKTPKSEIKELIEKRETLLNFSAIFHIVKGACNLEENGRKFKPDIIFLNRCELPRHIDCLKKIIELGGNVNARDFAGFTPLHYCVTFCGNSTTYQLAKILLENGADINAQNRFGETALCQPMLTKELGFVKLLLDYGIDPSIKDNMGMSAVRSNVFDADFNILFAQARKERARKKREDEKQKEGGVLSCEVCKKPSTRRCTGCYIVRYCSKDCQVSYWKSHKKICRENKDLFVPVQFNTLEEAVYNFSYINGGEITTINPTTKRPRKIFTVKIQVPRSIMPLDMRSLKMKEETGSLSLYNKKKDVYGNIPYDDPSYQKISQLIQSKGMDGLTGYFDAIFDNDDQLRINTSNLKLPKEW